MNSIRSFTAKGWEFSLIDNDHFSVLQERVEIMSAEKQPDGTWLLNNVPFCLLKMHSPDWIENKVGLLRLSQKNQVFANFSVMWSELSDWVVGVSEVVWEDKASEYVNAINALFRTIK